MSINLLLFLKTYCRPTKIFSTSGGARVLWYLIALVPVGQVYSQCLTRVEVSQMVRSITGTTQTAPNDALRKELLEMKQGVVDGLRAQDLQAQKLGRLANIVTDTRSESIDKTIGQKRDRNEARLCEILKTNGFPGKSLVGDDGVAAAFYLFKQFTPIAEQITMIPAVLAAVNKGELPKNEDYAAFIDRLRIHVGVKQLFGTQASAKGDFLMLSPIESEQQVDERRAQYGMSPLDSYIKYLEILYRLPVIRERSIGPPELKTGKRPDPVAESLQIKVPTEADDEVIRVESELVNLNIHLSGKSPAAALVDLQAKDFRVTEDGRDQEVSLFSKTDAPFDMIVLIDMSGSSQNKLGIIRKATRRFIEMARPGDRVSIMTFSDKIKVVNPLSADHDELLKSLDRIDDVGYSHVWDGLLFALRNGFGDRPPGRRRAIVMMSDGADNSLSNGRNAGSVASFAQLLEAVRNDDALVIPVFMETVDLSRCDNPAAKGCQGLKGFRIARSALSVLA